MSKRTERDQRTQEEKGPGVELGALVGPMLTGMATTRHDLLAWVHAHGLAALAADGIEARLAGQTVRKFVYVPGQVVNLVVG